MRITGPAKTGPAAGKKATKKTQSDGSAFADSLSRAGSAEQGAPARAAGPVAAVDALLALQEAPGGAEGRSKGLDRGHRLLDMLEEVRRGILLGAVPRERLMALARLARSRREGFADPELAGLLDEIELRAEVELAKLERKY